MIDNEGYRKNVGIILTNHQGMLFLARRVGHSSWQFPQGGFKPDETAEQAMFRELEEEIGLRPEHVRILGRTQKWLRYQLPKQYIRHHQKPVCIGQKQIWFMLSLEADEQYVDFNKTDTPEFDGWRWVSYWRPVEEVISFKRKVYSQALKELEPLCPSAATRPMA